MGGETFVMKPDKNDTEPGSNNVYLDVEHVWQSDPEHNIPESERRTICAIACMKMNIDYLLPELKDKLSLHAMVEEMKAVGAQDTRKYWRHSDQVNYFKQLGLVSFRRNWDAPSNDPKWFADNESYNLAQLISVSKQMSDEFHSGSRRNQIVSSLTKQFELGMPVIVSVKPGFSNNKQDHQIVLNGITNEGGETKFYFVDPALDPNMHQDRQTVTESYFFEKFNYRAIFAMTLPAYEKFVSKPE